MYAQIGPLSSGATEIQDIATNLFFALERLWRQDPDAQRQARTLAILDRFKGAMADGDTAVLERFVHHEAEEAFTPYLAPYTSYHGQEGEDGSEFGIRPDIEMLLEDARYRNGVVQFDDGQALTRQPEGIDFIVMVNDHGNVTLYDATSGNTIWSCV